MHLLHPDFPELSLRCCTCFAYQLLEKIKTDSSILFLEKGKKKNVNTGADISFTLFHHDIFRQRSGTEAGPRRAQPTTRNDRRGVRPDYNRRRAGHEQKPGSIHGKVVPLFLFLLPHLRRCRRPRPVLDVRWPLHVLPCHQVSLHP